MTTISYEATSRRVRVDGPCEEAECGHLRQALRTFGRMAVDLTVDLNHVQTMSPAAARAVVNSIEDARREGRDITIDCQQADQVSHALTTAGADQVTDQKEHR